MLKPTDGVAVEIVSCRGVGTQLRATESAPSDGERRELVNLTTAQIRACLEGSALRRALAVYGLTGAQFTRIFGRSADFKTGKSSRYTTGQQLRRVGRAFAIGRDVDGAPTADPLVMQPREAGGLDGEGMAVLRAAARAEGGTKGQLVAALRERLRRGLRGRLDRAAPEDDDQR